jgi:Na+/phosphate symporter
MSEFTDAQRAEIKEIAREAMTEREAEIARTLSSKLKALDQALRESAKEHHERLRRITKNCVTVSDVRKRQTEIAKEMRRFC